MSRSTWQGIAVGLISIVIPVVTGCAQPPVEQLRVAQHSLDEARAAGAPDYAKDAFVKLERRLILAKDELIRQEEGFSIVRLFDGLVPTPHTWLVGQRRAQPLAEMMVTPWSNDVWR